jgi:hypothetical protein
MSLVNQFDVVVVVRTRLQQENKNNSDSRREVLPPITKNGASDKCAYLILLASFRII